MTVGAYLRDRKITYLLVAACMTGCFAFLTVCGVKRNQTALLALAVCSVLTVWSGVDFWRRHVFFRHIQEIMEGLDKPYLISELLPESWRLEDRLYGELLKTSNKSVIDEIHALEKEQAEYREFIENWIHEVKVPLTALYLMCENENSDFARKIKPQLSLLEHGVERALFYARSENVYQDYMIHEMDLAGAVKKAIHKNSAWMIQNKVQIQLKDLDRRVWSDEKWVVFILDQLLINSVKYKKETGCLIEIRAEDSKGEAGGTRLFVTDTGIGIPSAEVPRVFDKGFTGSNGRNRAASTGIGLYLCKKLCDKLGIGIRIQSGEGQGTCVELDFPDGSSYFGRNLSKS